MQPASIQAGVCVRNLRLGKRPERLLTKLVLVLLLPALAACGTIRGPRETATPTPTPEPGPTATPLPTGIPPVTELGTAKNPFILAMPPSPRPSNEVLDAGKALASLLQKSTGYVVVPVMP